MCLPRCRSCLPLCTNTCSRIRVPPSQKPIELPSLTTGQGAHVTCWRRHVKPIDRVRAQQATCMLLRRSRAPIRRGRVAWTRSRRRGGRAGSPSYARARGSFLSRRSACPVNPRHGHGEGGRRGRGGRARNHGVSSRAIWGDGAGAGDLAYVRVLDWSVEERRLIRRSRSPHMRARCNARQAKAARRNRRPPTGSRELGRTSNRLLGWERLAGAQVLVCQVSELRSGDR